MIYPQENTTISAPGTDSNATPGSQLVRRTGDISFFHRYRLQLCWSRKQALEIYPLTVCFNSLWTGHITNAWHWPSPSSITLVYNMGACMQHSIMYSTIPTGCQYVVFTEEANLCCYCLAQDSSQAYNTRLYGLPISLQCLHENKWREGIQSVHTHTHTRSIHTHTHTIQCID